MTPLQSLNISYVITSTVTDPPFLLASYPAQSDRVLSGRLQDFGYSFDTDDFSEILSKIKQKDPEAVILDVGANIGLVSLLASSTELNVYSVEPNPENYKRYETSIRLNCLENYVTLYKNAVSEISGLELTLSVNIKSPGFGTLSDPQTFKEAFNSDAKRMAKFFAYKHKVTTITIDEVTLTFLFYMSNSLI